MAGITLATPLARGLVSIALTILLPAPRGATAAEAGGRLVTWIRRAGDADLRLSPDSAGSLRMLARESVCYQRLPEVPYETLCATLRDLGRSMGDGYREIPFGPRARGALDRLMEELGRPPPRSPEDEEAIARLRAAGTKARRASRSLPGWPDLSPTAGARAPPAGTVESEPEPVERIVDRALVEGARWVHVVGPADPAPGDAARVDETLSGLVRSVESTGSGAGGAGGRALRPCSLLVILVPRGGTPVAIASGPLWKRARVVTRPVDIDGLQAGLRALLGLPVGEGDLDWIRRGIRSEPERSPEGGGRE